MKIRLGFVGNSSSSSFIIGIGVPKDVERVRALALECSDIEVHDLDWKSALEKTGPLLPGLGDYSSKRAHMTDSGAIISVESFTGSEVSVEVTPEDKQVVTAYYGGSEGDSEFYDDYGDSNYYIDESFFQGNPHALNILDLFKDKELVDKAETRIGAGRDG